MRATKKVGVLISYENLEHLTQLSETTEQSISQIINRLLDAQRGTTSSKGTTYENPERI